jgi:hypothetical protein
MYGDRDLAVWPAHVAAKSINNAKAIRFMGSSYHT